MEPRVLVDVLDPDRMPRLGDDARNAMADLDTQGLDLLADDHAADELVSARIEQVQGGTLGLEQVAGLGENQFQQVVQVERTSQRFADLPQSTGDALLPRKSGLEVGALA